MASGDLLMSSPGWDRSHVICQTQEGGLSQRAASERLGIGVRRLKRLVRLWRQHEDAGLVSRRRGRASNHRLAAGQRDAIGVVLQEKYSDFGPTLAAKKLAARGEITASVETVRQMQIVLGLWRSKKRSQARVFCSSERRQRFGELIQIDRSPYAWFEDSGPRCTLIVFIHAATGRLTASQFGPAEAMRAYLEALCSHVLAHGCRAAVNLRIPRQAG